METALRANTKIVVPSSTELVNILADMAGIPPFVRGNGELRRSQRATPATNEMYASHAARYLEITPKES